MFIAIGNWDDSAIPSAWGWAELTSQTRDSDRGLGSLEIIRF